MIIEMTALGFLTGCGFTVTIVWFSNTKTYKKLKRNLFNRLTGKQVNTTRRIKGVRV